MVEVRNQGSFVNPSPAGAFPLSRPLFAPNRRKFDPPKKNESKKVTKPRQVTKKQIAPEKPDARVVGLNMTPNGSKVLLAINGGKTAQWFALNSVINNWKISAIDIDGIEISNGQKRIRMDIYPKAVDDQD